MKTEIASGLRNYDNSVQVLRTQINLLDEQIVKLLKERLQLVFQAREIKQIDGLPQHNLERELVIMSNITPRSNGLEKEYLEEVYHGLLSATRRIADKNQLTSN